jgi:DNA-binding beta-propeller fold protein YncE
MFRLKNCIDKTREISKNALSQKRARVAALSLTTSLLALALALAAPASAEPPKDIYKVIATIPLVSGADAMTIDEKRGKLYTAVGTDNNMAVVDLATNTVSKLIPFSGSQGFAITQDPVLGKVLAVGGSPGVVSIFDMATETLTATVKPPASSSFSYLGIAVNPLKGQYYVGLSYASYSVIAIYNEQSNNLVRQIKLPFAPAAMAVDPYRDKLYVLPPYEGPKTVLAIDLVSDTIGTTIQIPDNTGDGIKIDVYHGLVYVGGEFLNTPKESVPGSVFVIDEDTSALTQEIITSPFPEANATTSALTVQVAIDPINGIGYAVNWYFGSVDIFNLRTNELIDTITIPNDQVWGVVVDPIRRTVYASGSQNLYVISAGPAEATPYSPLAVDFPT